jgi:hypothetical protein
MTGSKLKIKNCDTKVSYFNYQDLTTRIVYSQVKLNPGQTKTIVCVNGSFNYNQTLYTINILSDQPYTE